MLEGLAVWALFIYILRVIGMPWNNYSKGFAYVGGASWLLFVWAGLLNYTPMDLSGGSVVQSPHIQLNDQIKKGQLIYEMDETQYQIKLNKAQAALESEQVALKTALEQVKVEQQAALSADTDIDILSNRLQANIKDKKWKQKTLERYLAQNIKVPNTITENQIDEQKIAVELAQAEVLDSKAKIQKTKLQQLTAKLNIEKATLAVASVKTNIATETQNTAQALWDLNSTKIYAPADGYVSNFIMREGQYISGLPRLHMYTNEKYVLMRVNHQAIRNIKVGQNAEFSSAVYPGKVFSAHVEGIIEATGESQGSLLALEANVRQTTGQNLMNKHHFVRLKINEDQAHDIPVGAVGLAWISGEKPIAFLNFLDVIRGIIIRMKSQIYYFYSI